jgi:hypothetical protein
MSQSMNALDMAVKGSLILKLGVFFPIGLAEFGRTLLPSPRKRHEWRSSVFVRTILARGCLYPLFPPPLEIAIAIPTFPQLL